MNLIRNLLALAVSTAMLPICMLAFRFTVDLPFDYDEICDELALSQLRETLLIAYDLQINDSSLDFICRNKDFSLSLVNGKMLLQPGTQIYLNDIDDLYFFSRNGCIYVAYERKGKTYERVLGSQKGIYIDEFSDCDVRDDSPDSSEE